jgi:ATP-dependent Clp protease adaptor protein ClpS
MEEIEKMLSLCTTFPFLSEFIYIYTINQNQHMKKKFYDISNSRVVNSTDVEIEVSDEVDAAIKKLFERSIILYNDDYNTFEHVIECLVKYCRHNPLQAEQCALIVHSNGKCSIKNGSYEVLSSTFTTPTEERWRWR